MLPNSFSHRIKHAILAYPRKFSLLSILSFGAFALSGGVTAVVNIAPESASTPTITALQTPIALPTLEYLSASEAPYIHEATVRAGETIVALLARLGIKNQNVPTFITQDPAARELLRQIKPGALLIAQTTAQGELLSLTLPQSDGKTGTVITVDQGNITLQERPLALEQRTQTASGQIRSSLFGAADDIGLPDEVTLSLVELFGRDIDFRKDLQPGDQFNVVYQTQTYRGVSLKSGRILGAEFINRDKRYSAFWHESEYYDADGRSLKEGFLRSPLEFSRVSSGFSVRMHPIQKVWKKHAGTDFAAATGTGVKATSDGVVEFIGTQKGYGNVIVLKHSNGYNTLYAHLSRFAAGVTKGQKVSQNELIGHVGSTGWATGPHLHYELRINDVPHNPMTVTLPESHPLSEQQLARFRTTTQPVFDRLAQLASPAKVAQK